MSVARRLTKEAENITDCSICMQTMKTPKILPCIHTFCLTCLQRHGRETQTSGDPTCPVCRSPFRIVDGEYSSLPNNDFVEMLINAKKLTNRQNVGSKRCDVCLAMGGGLNKSTTATMYCVECMEYMCDQCSDIHKSMKMTRTHRLRSTGDCPSLKECLELTASYCDQHPKKQIGIYCEECKSVCCEICYTRNHKAHKYSEVNNAADHFKTLIENDIDDIEKLISENKKQACNLQTMRKEYVTSVDRIKLEISIKSERLETLVDEHKAVLLNELEAKKPRQFEEFDHIEDDLQLRMTSLNSFNVYSYKVVDKARSADIVRVANDLIDRAATLKQQTVVELTK